MIRIRFATEEDNQKLLELAATSGMEGIISVRTDRYPDFFGLLKLRGEHRILVAETEGRIIGSISATKWNSIWLGRIENVWYIADFKVTPAYRSTLVAAKLGKELRKILLSENSDILMLAAAAGNKAVSVFFSGRAGFQTWRQAGRFFIYLMPPLFGKLEKSPYKIMRVKADHKLQELYHPFLKEYGFAPIYSTDYLHSSTHFAAFRGNTICAAISLADTIKVRQNVLIRLPVLLKILYMVLKPFSMISGNIRLPATNQIIKMVYIRAFGVKAGEEKALSMLVQQARLLVRDEKYSLLAWGLHDLDPLRKVLHGIPRTRFVSLPYFTSLKGNDAEIDMVAKSRLYLDYSVI